MNTDDFLRSPRWLDPDFPFKVEVRINKKNDRIVLTIETPEGWARDLREALDVLTALQDLIRRRIGHARHLQRLDAQLLAARTDNRGIFEAYRQARKTGKKHREAVRLVARDPAFSHLLDRGWERADFARVIRHRSDMSMDGEA